MSRCSIKKKNRILPVGTMLRDELLDLFRRSGALLDGHFRLSSGLHSAGYLQCALVLQHPAFAESLGADIASHVRALGANVVLSPALGGIVIGQEVGRALGVRAIFAERQDGLLALLGVDLPTYQPEACPLCAKGLAIAKPGSRPVTV